MDVFGSILYPGLFVSGLIFYVRTWRAIFSLVDESRQLDPTRRFVWFWWVAAWRVHRRAYSESRTRRRIVMNSLLTCAFGVVSMVCLSYLR